MKGVYQFQSWKDFSKKLPLTAVIGLVDEWMTIYACLQQAIKVFDNILIVGDNASEKSVQYMEKFLFDHRSIAEGKIQFVELGHFDPWPWMSLYDPKNSYKTVADLPLKSQSKADYKRISLAKTMYGNSIVCSLHSDILVFDDTKQRILERMSDIENPFFDSEWFSMITLYDKNTARTFLSKDSSPGNLKKDPSLNQRTVYDYPGDWGLMSIYGSSLVTPGPDPLYGYYGCLWPWSKKTQLQKKGQDSSIPHAIHLEHIRDRSRNKSFKNEAWSLWKTERFENEDHELYEKIKIMDHLNIPVDFWLDKENILRIEEKIKQ
jgi:hypothetical protein